MIFSGSWLKFLKSLFLFYPLDITNWTTAWEEHSSTALSLASFHYSPIDPYKIPVFLLTQSSHELYEKG